jgi:formylglycine-generating enzyme required for sulfatase activity
VGSYTGSPSPYGTFDQGGNVEEWNEAILSLNSNTLRALRGGSYFNAPIALAASHRRGDFPELAIFDIGFRVAIVPEPSTGLLVFVGLLGLTGWRRRRN